MIRPEWLVVSISLLMWVIFGTLIWGLHWGTYYTKPDGSIESRQFIDIGGMHSLIEFQYSDVQERNRGNRVAKPLRGAQIAGGIGLGLILGVWLGLSFMGVLFPGHNVGILVAFSFFTWLITSVISTHAFTKGANLPGTFAELWDGPWMPSAMSTILVAYTLLMEWHYFQLDALKPVWDTVKVVKPTGYITILVTAGTFFAVLHEKYFHGEYPMMTRISFYVSVAVFAGPSMILGLILSSYGP